MTKFLDLDGLRRVTENVHLRLDCKQDKLAGLPGQIVGFGTEGANAVSIYAGDNIELKQDNSGLTISAPAIHQNLLDNWYFVNPINQRGISAWKTGYGIDSWFSEGVSATVGNDGVTLERTDHAIAFTQRWDESRVKRLIGKKLTLSLLTTRGISCFVFQVVQDEDGVCRTVAIKTMIADVEVFGAQIDSSTGIYQMVRIVPKINERITLIATKLEVGSVQTLARQDADGNWVLNDLPPNPMVELLKCRRYLYNPFYGYAEGYAALGIGQGYNATTADIFLHNSTSMRIMPIPIYKGAFSLTPSNVSGADIPITKIEVIAPTCNASITTLRCTVAGGIAIGSTYILRRYHDTTAQFLLSAEL